MYAAALDRAPALELKVAQLPFVAGERWVGAAAAPPELARQALARRPPAAAVPGPRSRSPGW